VNRAEDKLKEKIEEIIRQKAESSESDELSDSEHGYVDALIWLKEGSTQLTNEGIGKERVRAKICRQRPKHRILRWIRLCP